MTRAIAVIPARWGSTRFPGKPLAEIRGRTLIERTFRIARAAEAIDDVVVATDDARIAEHVRGFGGRAVMTAAECETGTARVQDALGRLDLDPSIVVNLQGDSVLTPPWVVDEVARAMRDDACVEIATPAVRLSWPELDEMVDAYRAGRVGGTTVTFANDGNALYFSKTPIPNVRERGGDLSPAWRHIGLYGYTPAALGRWLSLAPTPLERAEKLEQLRPLEHGLEVRVVTVDYRGRTHASVDNPEDVEVVAAIIERDGELC